MYLLDTNIFLEILLQQEKAEQAKKLITSISPDHLWITDFSTFSIGIMLFNHNRHEDFEKFLQEIFNELGIQTLRLSRKSLNQVKLAAKEFKLDFDDAYQYVTAKTFDLTLVTFDKDFKRTDLSHHTPAEILKEHNL